MPLQSRLSNGCLCDRLFFAGRSYSTAGSSTLRCVGVSVGALLAGSAVVYGGNLLYKREGSPPLFPTLQAASHAHQPTVRAWYCASLFTCDTRFCYSCVHNVHVFWSFMLCNDWQHVSFHCIIYFLSIKVRMLLTFTPSQTACTPFLHFSVVAIWSLLTSHTCPPPLSVYVVCSSCSPYCVSYHSLSTSVAHVFYLTHTD